MEETQEEKEWNYQKEEFYREQEMAEFGLFDNSASIMDRCKDLALIRIYDSYSPACECPVLYVIAQKGKGVIWKQSIAYMAEYSYSGCAAMHASADQRKEACDEWVTKIPKSEWCRAKKTLGMDWWNDKEVTKK